MAFIDALTLAGRDVILEPLTAGHLDALQAAAADGSLWKLWYTFVPPPEKTAEWIAASLAQRESTGALPFVIRRKRDDRVLGTTRFFNVDAVHRRVEIGHTWLSKSVQRSSVNVDCKLTLLSHAFETLDCIAVEFRTHFMNFQSREAITRLGAKQDGILRNHQRMPDGTLRDTVVFSIVQAEWPTVKRHLQHRLEAAC